MDLKIAGKDYRTNKLNAREQFHVSRRLMPILVARLDGLRALAVAVGVPGAAEVDAAARAEQRTPEEQATDAKSLAADEALVASFLPVANAMAKMPQADVDYVLDVCLGVCQRLEGQQFAPVMANGRLMYQDLDMAGMMQLVQAVVTENCGNFFPVPPVSAKPS